MKSDCAKVLHEVAGRPLIVWAVETARAAGAERVVAVLGHQLSEVKAALDARYGEGTIEVTSSASSAAPATRCRPPCRRSAASPTSAWW